MGCGSCGRKYIPPSQQSLANHGSENPPSQYAKIEPLKPLVKGFKITSHRSGTRGPGVPEQGK